MVWYSAEVTGTIMVQCIPVMRPLLGEMKTSLTSRRLADAESGQVTTGDFKRRPSTRARPSTTVGIDSRSEEFMLSRLQSPGMGKNRVTSQVSLTPSEVDRAIEASRTRPLEWPLSGNETPVIGAPPPHDRNYTYHTK